LSLSTSRPKLASPRLALTGAACLCLAPLSSRGIVSLNDGRDKIYVTGSVTIASDSNIFANAQGGGDYSTSATVSAEYSRRAGLIGVDASLSVTAMQYSEFKSENFSNPKMSLEFTKQAGRTTGSLLFTGARESRADSAANIRNESWNYASSLNLRYPVIERYSVSGGVGYTKRDFQDNTLLVDLDSFSANVDLFYVYTSERDLIAGYRFRREKTSASNSNTDHSINVGLSGKVLPKLHGSIRVGAQTRISSGDTDETFDSWFSSMSLTWNAAKRTTVTGSVSKDFSTTSTNISTDTLSGQLSAVYTMTARWAFSANLASGYSEFLGVAGAGRTDFFFTYGFDVNYTLNQHFKASLSASRFQNWSTLAYSDFDRDACSLTLTSRW